VVTLTPEDSIQQAIDQLALEQAEGSVICLGAGHWEENLWIGISLTLIGQSYETTSLESATPGHPVIRIESDSEIQVRILKINISGADPISRAPGGRWCAAGSPFWICPSGVQVLGKAQVTLMHVSLLNNWRYGLEVRDEAQVALIESNVLYNEGAGVFVVSGPEVPAQVTISQRTNILINGMGVVLGRGEVNIHRSFISSNRWDGIKAYEGLVRLIESRVVKNGRHGIFLHNSPIVLEVLLSVIAENGQNPRCSQSELGQTAGALLGMICNGILVEYDSQTTITDSTIVENTDWGVAAHLIMCGYREDLFTGEVIFQGNNTIAGNNLAGNHQGEVCLP
jgi:hypothetical protein